jgi:hypothetical protein
MAKVLHASRSGYFPSCLSQNSTLATQSLTDAMEIYWKVRSWAVTISGDVFGYQVFVSTASDETDLVCGSDFLPSIDAPYLDLYRFYLGGPLVDSYLNPQKYAVLPAFTLVCESNDGNSQEISSEFIDGRGTLLGGTFSFYGKSYRLFFREEGSLELSGSVIPNSYWSYGGTYDTATGARL